MKIKGFTDLVVWQKAMTLVEEVYRVTRVFPSEERYGLVSQMRRAAVSVPSNIAEGQARKGNAEFRNFLSIAKGSLAELHTQLIVAQRLGYGEVSSLDALLSQCQEVDRMIHSLSEKLAERNRQVKG